MEQDWRTWSRDESLFAGAAGYYEQGRLPYAPGLAEVLARGLDPDPGMLAHAARAAADQAIANATWVQRRAEVVQVDAPAYRPDELAVMCADKALPFPPPPEDALDELRRRYLGEDRRAGQAIRNTSPSGEDEVFQQAGFLAAETVTVPDRRIIHRTIDDIVAAVFSTSSTAPHLFGDRQQDYERDVRAILSQASTTGQFSVRLPDNILRIWRLPPYHAPRGAVSSRNTRTKSRIESTPMGSSPSTTGRWR